jgi:lambda family phage portal protein
MGVSFLDAAVEAQWGSASTAFRGADWTRLSNDRLSSASHPDNEVMYAARTLRARARDLVRNNPYAAGVVEAFAANVIGEQGIRLKPTLTLPRNDPKGEPDQQVNWIIERAWERWGCDYASVDEMDSWHELERLIVKSWVTDGEVFIRRRKAWDNPFGFAVEVIDADLLDETFNMPAERNRGREIVMGVELDERGRRVAYHFWDRHPDDMRAKRVPIPASEITHFFVRYRADQTRGYSLFAPVLTTVEMLDGYSEAELVAARYHASKMGFITNDSPEAAQAYATRLASQNAKGKQDQPRYEKIRHGMVKELMPGQGFESFDPTHPADAFDPFLKVMQRGVARGFSISYLTYTGDVGEANYSSMRAGLLPERDQWKILQRVTSRRVHQPTYRDWLGMALLTRQLKGLPTSIAADYYDVEWRGRRWDWVDPRNDIEAAENAIHLGITSRQRVASDRGLDFETIIDESAEDQAYAKKADVWIGGAGGVERIKVEDPNKANGGSRPNGNNPKPSANGHGNGNHNRLLEHI